MTTTTNSLPRPPADSRRTRTGGTDSVRSRFPAAARRRSVPHLLLGLLLVVACAAGFMLLSLNMDHRQHVLAIANGVTVGHVLGPDDLREVSVAADPAVSVVDADQVTAVVGRRVGTSLPAGSLLTSAAISSAPIPGAGQGIAALALKSGQFPPALAPGSRVAIVAVPTSTGSGSASPTGGASGAESPMWSATVTDVSTPQNEQVTVVSVAADSTAAREIAAVPAGQLSVVMLGGEH